MGSSAGESFQFTGAIGDAFNWTNAALGSPSLQQQLDLAIRFQREGITPENMRERRNIIQMQQDLFHHGSDRWEVSGGGSSDTGGIDWQSLSGDLAFGGNQGAGIGSPTSSFDIPGLSGDGGIGP